MTARLVPRTRQTRIAFVLPLLALACGGGPETREVANETTPTGSTYTSFEEFEKTVPRAPETNRYVVNGDEAIDDIKHLREHYERSRAGALIALAQGSGIATWSNEDKYNLRYCVSPTFGSVYQVVVNAMAEATAAWESVASVKFIYEYTEDANCTATNQRVMFEVQPMNSNGRFSGYAFPPGAPRQSRQLFLDQIAFGGRGLTPVGVTRHELGHVLGFRHEHTRPEAGPGCYEDNNWVPLTAYDQNSVMHYPDPKCGGTPDTIGMELTQLDAEGAARVYGSPGQPMLYNPAPNAIVSPAAGEVGEGKVVELDPIEVRPGTSFNVTMSGAGDPDLYVGFDGPPSAKAFACRPFRTGPREECRLTVPEGKTKAYVSVRGYEKGSYKVEAAYTAP